MPNSWSHNYVQTRLSDLLKSLAIPESLLSKLAPEATVRIETTIHSYGVSWRSETRLG
jgi:hypothetical protein